MGYNAHPDDEVFAPDSPTDPEPEDSAADVPYWDVELSVEVSHPSGLSMDVSFYDLSHSLIGTDYNVGSGSRASVEWPDLDPDTTYWWYAVVDDGTWTTRSDNWYFITSDFDPQGESVEGTELTRADENDVSSTENTRRKRLDRTFLEVTSLRADSPLIYLDQDNTLFVTVSNVGGDAGDESYKENISGSIEEIETLLDEYSDHPRARQLEKAVEDLEEAMGLVSEHQREQSIKSVRKAAVHLNAAGRGRQGIPTEEVVIALAGTVQLKVVTVIREAKRNFGTGHPDVQEAEELFGEGVEKLEDERYVPALNKFRKAFEVVLNAYICDAYVDVHSWMPDGYESDIGSGYIEDLEAETSETITLNWHPTERGVHQVRADMMGEYEVYSSPVETVEGPSKLTSFGMTVTSMSDEYVEWPDGKVIDADDDDLEFPSEGYDSTTIYMYKDVEGGDLVIKDGGSLIFNDHVTFVIENPEEPGQYGIDIKAGGNFVVNSPLRDTTIMSSAQDPEYTYSFKNYGTIDFTGADVMYTYGTSGSGGIRNLGESICSLQNTRVLEAYTDSIYVTDSSEVSVKGEETVIGRQDEYNENIATGHGVHVEDGITPDIEDATVQYNQKSGIYLDSSSPELEPVHADDIQDYESSAYDTQLTDDGSTSTRPVVAAGNGAVYTVYLDEDADRVYFMRSYDEGVTWTEPMVVPGSDIEDENRYIGNIDFAADGDNLAVAWEVWTEDFNDTIPNIYVQYSYTGGEDDNWADEPYEIGLSYNPSVEVEDDNIYMVYVYRPWPPLTIIGSIRVVWTGDNWDESEGHGFGIEEGVPKIAVVGDTVHVVIADEENIYYTKSDDGGERWDELNVVVEYENITEDVVDNYSDMHRYISLDATENRAYLVWAEYDTASERFEVYGKYAGIEDGWIWSEKKIHISYESTGDSVDNAVTTDIDGNWYVVWQEEDTDGSRMRYSRLNKEGEIEVRDSYLTSDLRPAKLPSISIDSSNNAYIVWQGDRRGVAEISEIYIKQGKGGVSDSTIRYNEKNGVTLRRSNNNSIAGNEIHSNSYGIRVRMSEKKDIVEYNYIHDNRIGIGLSRGSGDFPSPIKNITISNNNLARNQVGMWLDWSQENIIKYNTVSESDWHGIWIRHSWQEGTNPSKNNTFSSNHIHSNGVHGIYLYRTEGYNNNISGNIVEDNRFNGIFLYFSDDNTVTDNTASNNGYGIRLWDSHENRVTGNTLSDNEYGIRLDYSHSNMIYHNSFINNENHAYDEGGSSNQWDNGYPSGGNYWDDHTGPDDYKGWFQNVLGSDGIVDHPVGIPGLGAINIDSYPVVDPDRFNPKVDEIKIVDTSLVGEDEIYDSELHESETITGFAAGYNDTFGYIGDINVAWDVDNFDGADAYTSLTEGESSTFHAGDSTGTAVWTAYYEEGVSDSVEFKIFV